MVWHHLWYSQCTWMNLYRNSTSLAYDHKYCGSLGCADDFKLLRPSIKSLQKILKICAKFGKRFDAPYNAKTTVYIAFSGAVDVSNGLNDDSRIYLIGSRLEWKMYVNKNIGNHIRYNLSESKEMIRQRGHFIDRVIVCWSSMQMPTLRCRCIYVVLIAVIFMADSLGVLVVLILYL